MQLYHYTSLNTQIFKIRESEEKSNQLLMILSGIEWGMDMIGRVVPLSNKWPFTIHGYRQSTCTDKDMLLVIVYNIGASTCALLWVSNVNKEHNLLSVLSSWLNTIQIQLIATSCPSDVKRWYYRFDPNLNRIIKG